MTTFIIIAAAMVLVAVALLVPALLGRRGRSALDRGQQNVRIARERLAELEADRASGALTEEAYAQTRAELEEALGNDLIQLEGLEEGDASARSSASASRWTIATLAVAIPVLAGLIYAHLGMPAAFQSPQALASAGGLPSDHPPISGEGGAASFEEMLATLQERVSAQPDDPQAWFALGSLYMNVDRYNEAAKAFAKTHELAGNEPAVLLRYADALAMAHSGRISGKPFELIQTALQVEPDNPMALWLAGLGYAEQGQFETSIRYWERLLPLLQGDPGSTAQVQTLIAQARQQLDGGTSVASADPSAGPAAPPQPNPPTAANAAGGSVVVSVALDPQVAERAAPTDTVFIFATALNGPPMPLAVARRQVKDLPLQVTLNDAMAMMPAMKLSNFPEVRVGARISKTGSAVPQSGDLQGEVAPVKVGTSDRVSVVIDKAVP